MKYSNAARAFTLIELIAVIVVLAILSGVAIPKYFDYSNRAKESSIRGTLGAVRSGVAHFYANASMNGTAAYPTLTQLTTYDGTGAMQEPIPANPYKTGGVRAATWTAAQAVTADTEGWNYDATSGKFWANSNSQGENAW